MTQADDYELQIAVRSQELDLPNNFKFTVIAEITPGQLFKHRSFQIMRLYAAGTREGPIVLFKVGACSIDFVCLCCAHTAEITDIIQLRDRSRESFISADCDGDVCIWSNIDGSCKKILRRVANPGEVRFAYAPKPDDSIVVWTRGFDAKIVKLEDGSVIRRLKTIGINAIVFITPEHCPLMNTPAFIVVKFGSIRRVDPNFEKENAFRLPENWNEVVHVSQFGIVKTEGITWKLMNPLRLVECANGKITGTAKGDRIADVKWMDSNHLCLGTFMSKFLIAVIRYTTVLGQPVVHVDETIVVNASQPDFTTRFLFSSNKILHATSRGTIEAISVKGKHVQSSDVRPSCVSFVSKDPNGVILKTLDPHRFLAINGSSWDDFHIPSKITALTFLPSVSSQPEIIVGTEDGQVFCCELGKSEPTDSATVFSDKIVGLTRTKLWPEQGELLVAIGSEGTIAILRHISVLMVYASNDFPVKRLYQDPKGRLLGVLRVDGSVVTFSKGNPGPRRHSSIIPRHWELLWAASSVGTDRNCRLMVSMGGNAIQFARIDVKELLKNAKKDVFATTINAIREIFEESPPSTDETGPVLKSQSVNFQEGYVSRGLPRSQSSESLLVLDHALRSRMKTSVTEFECDVRSGDLSFVLLGDSGMPTFFYKDFKLNGMKICHASQKIATVHYIIKALVSGQMLEALDAEELLL